MRYFFYILLGILSLLALAFTLLFTPVGNTLLTPYIESKLNEKLPIQGKLIKFSLTTNHFYVQLEASKKEHLIVDGNYHLLDQNFTATYDATLKHFQYTFKDFTLDIDEPSTFQGSLKGNYNSFIVVGKSNIANANQSYTLLIKEQKVDNIELQTIEANASKLENIAHLPHYLDGLVDITLTLKNIQHPSRSGFISVVMEDAIFNNDLLLQEFNVTLKEPHASFLGNIRLKEGEYYLQTLIEQEHQFTSRINFKGGKNEANLKADIVLNDGNVTLTSTLYQFTPSNLLINVQHLPLDTNSSPFSVHNNPFQSGIIDGVLSFSTLNPLDGEAKLEINNLQLNTSTFEKLSTLFDYNSSHNTVESELSIKNHNVYGTMTTTSDMGVLNMPQMEFNLDNYHFNSDFYVENFNIASLTIFKDSPFANTTNIVGNIQVDDTLHVKAKTFFCDGEVNLQMQHRTLHVEGTSLNLIKLFHLLNFPAYIHASVDLNASYDLSHHEGTLKSSYHNASFINNSIFDTIENHTGLNIYADRFEGVSQTQIENEIFINTIELSSPNVIFNVTDGYLNVKTLHNNATLESYVDNKLITFSIKGELFEPDIEIESIESF